MIHTITANEKFVITLAPRTPIEEILQNVAMIISTVKNTAPLFRDFGITAEFIDKPTAAAEAMLIADIFDAIEMYEPRAEILSVTFTRNNLTGRLSPVVEVGINAE